MRYTPRIMPPLTTAQLLDELEATGLLVGRTGPDATIQRATAAETCGPGDLVFADVEAYLEPILQRKPAAVVTTPELAARLAGVAVLTAPNVRLAQAHILQRYFDRDLRNEGWPRVHPSAVVHDTVAVPESVTIGPNAVVGLGVRLGPRCVVLAGAVVEHDAVIGADTIVHSNAVIGWGCLTGERCIVKAGAVIGSEGF